MTYIDEEDYSNLNEEQIEEALKGIMNKMHNKPRHSEPHLKLYTGAYGKDSFDEMLHFHFTGLRRFYIGKKVMRIIKTKTKVHKSIITDRYFKLYKP